MDLVKVHFLGASKTVTGSKFYLETPEINIMVDCGMFQGLKELRQLNWQKLPIKVSDIDFVLLTHGHLDHTGYLPRLIKEGFKGTIIGTAPTLAITEIILADSAKIHKEEAEKANKEGYSRHNPALPFYTMGEVEKTVGRFRSEENNKWVALSTHIKFRFVYNGHIIGSVFIELEVYGKLFVFSGDVGRTDDYLLAPPLGPKWADYLFIESTYGHKEHPAENVENILVDLIHQTVQDRGTLIIPSFAVERLQSLMYILWKLYKKNHIPNIPIFVDSPMGNNVLSIFKQFPKWHKLPMQQYNAMCQHMNIVSSYKETWETIDDPRPKIVIAGSGMVTGGRVLTYLRQLIDKKNSKVLLVGFQAEGTRGRLLLEGAHEIKIFGKYFPVNAQIIHIESLSAHADQSELLNWLKTIKNIPEKVFLIHGESLAMDTFKVKINDVYGWHTYIPSLFEVVTLSV